MKLKSETYASGALIGMTVFLLLYVLLPVLFILPVEAMRRRGVVSDAFMSHYSVLFSPLEKLDSICPPYQRLIRAEVEWVQNFLPPLP